MPSGGPQREPPRRPRAAVQAAPFGQPRPRLRGWTRIDPHSPIPPVLVSIFEHFLPAGPLFGVLSTMYRYHLGQTAPLAANPATHEILRQTRIWHGHVLSTYYITPAQNAVWWALSVPAMVWLVMGIATLMVLGIRSHYAQKPR